MPRPTVSGWAGIAASGLERMSPSETSRRLLLGTSTPIADLPGIGTRIRTSGVARA